jgi:hypothetical protein
MSRRVRSVSNDVRVDAPHTEESGFDLLGRVVAPAEHPSRCRNEHLDGRNVGEGRLPNPYHFRPTILPSSSGREREREGRPNAMLSGYLTSHPINLNHVARAVQAPLDQTSNV